MPRVLRTSSALIGLLALSACGGTSRQPSNPVYQTNQYRCQWTATGPSPSPIVSVSFDTLRNCPANLYSPRTGFVSIGLSALTSRTDMSGGSWIVRNRNGGQVGSGSVTVLDQTTGDIAVVSGTYLGGTGTPFDSTQANQRIFEDSATTTVSFAGTSSVVLKSRHVVLRSTQRPQLLGPTVSSMGYPSHFYMYMSGPEPVGFRYRWYVDGQEVVPYGNAHTFDHAFSVTGWHSVQVHVQWADDEDQWESLSVYAMDCGGPNQCLRAPPGPPPDDLPDARHQQTSPRMPGMRSGSQ
jgi:hypothetical protein